MILKSIQVKNFRSINDETLNCENLTALVGANGSGKSSFLHAIKLFQNKSPKISEDDYYNKNTKDDIVISITFKDLSESAKKVFEKYVQNNELTVERVIEWNEGKPTLTFHGSTLQNPDFIDVITESATNAKSIYAKLRNEKYVNFPTWKSHSQIKEFLKKNESENPDQCKRLRDDGQFFGYNEVAQGCLVKFVKFLHIPAVRDASTDASEGKDSILTELLDLVIRQRLAEREEIKKLQEDTMERYTEIMNTSKLKDELKDLEEKMTKTLQSFAPNTKIDLTWQPVKELEIRLPEAVADLVEDDYQSTVARTGHGLQRAFIMTMLQHLSSAQANAIARQSSGGDYPTLVLIIEEPELYQHPSRQRHLAEILFVLTRGKISGVSEKTQIIYSTHSPHFVGIDRINQIRLLRKIAIKNKKPKTTKIFNTNLQEAAVELSHIHNSSRFTEDGLRPRLQTIMTPWMNEGFFARIVVLVEGEADRAAIIGIAKMMGYMLESMGIAIIPCFGKTNLDKPAIIFRKLKIPIYVIWDSDKGKRNANPEENHHLLTLMNQNTEDWPSNITDTFACFEKDMQDILEKEIGKDVFDNLIQKYKKNFSMEREQVRKNPVALAEIIKEAKSTNHLCKTLEKIVQNIIRLQEKS